MAVRYLYFFTAISVFWFFLPAAFAQSTNTRPCDDGSGLPPHWQAGFDERLIGVCGLEDTVNTFSFDGSVNYQGQIPFSVRSCFPGWQQQEICEQAVPYTVTISSDTPSNANSFRLCRNPGCPATQSFDIELSYSSNHQTALVRPGIEVPSGSDISQFFPGGANGRQVPATLSFRIVRTPSKVQNDVYSANFLLTIRQCSSARPIGGGSICNGQARYTDLISLPFRIELRPNSLIRISGLEDMTLTVDPGVGAVGSQDFCAESTGGAQFRIIADSSSGSGSFILQSTDQLQYSTEILHLPSGRSEVLQEGQRSTAAWPGHTSSLCQNLLDENMRINILVEQSELEKATNSTYSDTLTLTIELE